MELLECHSWDECSWMEGIELCEIFILFELLTAKSSLGFCFRDEGGPDTDMYILQSLFLFRLNCCDYNWKNLTWMPPLLRMSELAKNQNEIQISSALFWQKISKNARAFSCCRKCNVNKQVPPIARFCQDLGSWLAYCWEAKSNDLH